MGKEYTKGKRIPARKGESAVWYEEFLSRWPLQEYTSFSPICEKLNEECGARWLETNQIPSLWMHKFNAAHMPINEEELHLSEESLRIQGIVLPAAAKAGGTYDIRDSDREDVLPYLVYEEQVGYHYSNSNKLFLEVDIARGVTQADVDCETERYNVWKKNCVAYWKMTGIVIGNIEEWKKIYPQELE